MEPENNVSNTGAEPIKTEPAVPENSVVFADEPKKSGKGMLLCMLLLIILAIGGIAFGVWEMLDSKTQQGQLNSQINTLKQQNNELQNQISNNTTLSTDTINPVIKSQNPDEVNHVFFITRGNQYINIMLDEGKINYCAIESDSDGDNSIETEDCNLDDIEGEIYKIISFGDTQEYDPYIGFVMADGVVKYFSFYDALNNGTYELKTLNMEKKVIDALGITAGSIDPRVSGGYKSTIFVFNDGTFAQFDESMLQQ